MNMTETCRLCLAGSSQDSSSTLTTLEDDELRRKIDKIFYFQVPRIQDVPSMICVTCRDMVVGFYEYAEQVQRNQDFLRSTLMPSTSSFGQTPLLEAVTSQESVVMGEGIEGCNPIKLEYTIKHEPDDSEWTGLGTYCETTYTARAADGDKLEPIHHEIEVKQDEDKGWNAFNSTAAEEENDDEAESDSGESETVEKHTFYCEEEDTDGVKPKRKYTPRKNSSPRKKPKTEGDIPTIDELVLEHYQLSCDLCGESLEDFTDLRKHYKYVHNEQGYLKCCNKKIFKKCWMIEHIQLHLNPDTFHCDICNKSYSSSKVLKEHTKEVHAPNENRPFKCETCLKSFVSNAHLNAHIMVAHGSVQCPQCPKILASQGSLKKHLVAMHGDGEQHVCEVCARVFRSKQCFDTHVKGHLGTRLENKVQCSYCSVWLTDKYCLTKHVRRMHATPDEPLPCELCGKQLRNQDALTCHMRRAHSESRFECDVCHKKFKRPHHMREHVAIHHTGENLYGCNHCLERFNTKNKQYMHRKTVHPVEWEEEMRKRMMKDP